MLYLLQPPSNLDVMSARRLRARLFGNELIACHQFSWAGILVYSQSIQSVRPCNSRFVYSDEIAAGRRLPRPAMRPLLLLLLLCRERGLLLSRLGDAGRRRDVLALFRPAPALGKGDGREDEEEKEGNDDVPSAADSNGWSSGRSPSGGSGSGVMDVPACGSGGAVSASQEALSFLSGGREGEYDGASGGA